MRQLPLAGLALSPALSSADPAAIARRAGADRLVALRLQRRADQLTALGGRLRAGTWVSSAAARFARAAAEQARRLQVAATLVQQLAEALVALAADLGGARDDALAAVAHGRRLDVEVAQFNHRLRAQHTLLPQDPDSLLLSDASAADLTDRSQRAAGQLASAEARARRAWRQAHVAFDLVGQATPEMRRRMVSGSWDPAASVALAAAGVGGVTTCGPMDELALPSNGTLTGPDGRAYHLIVQTARDRDGRLLVTTEEQPADREGWHQLAVRFGTTAHGRKALTWEKVAVGLGGAPGRPIRRAAPSHPRCSGSCTSSRRWCLRPGAGGFTGRSGQGGTRRAAPRQWHRQLLERASQRSGRRPPGVSARCRRPGGRRNQRIPAGDPPGRRQSRGLPRRVRGERLR